MLFRSISYDTTTADIGKVRVGDTLYLYCGDDGWKEQVVTCNQETETPDCGETSTPGIFKGLKKILAMFKAEGAMTKSQCSTFCAGLNGVLPTILNDEDNTRFHWQMKYYDENRSWLGLYDTTEEDTATGWVWTKGDISLSYNNWAANEPNNLDERCATITEEGTWLDMLVRGIG